MTMLPLLFEEARLNAARFSLGREKKKKMRKGAICPSVSNFKISGQEAAESRPARSIPLATVHIGSLK